MLQRYKLALVALLAIVYGSPAFSVTPGLNWKDSYSVDGQCYCDTTYDHETGTIEVDTPQGTKTVREICETIGPGPGAGDNPIYNDVQCGNGPPNNAIDEVLCPGRVDMGSAGCEVIGPTWNLDTYFPAPDTETSGTTTEGTTGGSTDETDNSGDGVSSGDTTGEEASSGTTENETTINNEQPPSGRLFEAEELVTADSRWVLIQSSTSQDTSNDSDANHSASAGNASYFELLPDTLVTSNDVATNDNQWNTPGTGPILQYEVDIPAAGVYAIAVRGYATGDYDRRIHAGVDGLWNTGGANITLCETNRWSWSDCDDSNHTVEFSSAGIHQLMFSAADDGFEFDQFVLSDAPIASIETLPELASAVSLGNGVAFGAAVAPCVFGLLGLLLLVRRKTAH